MAGWMSQKVMSAVEADSTISPYILYHVVIISFNNIMTLYFFILIRFVSYHIIMHYIILSCYLILYCIALYCTLLYHIVLYCVVLYYIILYRMKLLCIVEYYIEKCYLYSVILYYIAPRYIVLYSFWLSLYDIISFILCCCIVFCYFVSYLDIQYYVILNYLMFFSSFFHNMIMSCNLVQ